MGGTVTKWGKEHHRLMLTGETLDVLSASGSQKLCKAGDERIPVSTGVRHLIHAAIARALWRRALPTACGVFPGRLVGYYPENGRHFTVKAAAPRH